MSETDREIVIESLKLNAHIPDFSMRNVSLPKLSKVLRRRGYEIDIIREGQRIDIPIPAYKRNYIILMNPLENWITVEAEALSDAVDGWNSISQILLRDFRIFKVSKYVLDTTLSVKCKGEKASDNISRVTAPVRDSLNLIELLQDESVNITGFKITTANLSIIVDEWHVDPSYYFIRIVYESEDFRKISEFKIDDFVAKLIERVEGFEG